MRAFDSGVVTEYRKEAFSPFLMVQMAHGGDYYRFTDCDVPIAMGGDVYLPRDIACGAKYAASVLVDSANVSIDNLDDYLTSIFVGGDCRGAEIIIRMAIMIQAGPGDMISVDEEDVGLRVTDVGLRSSDSDTQVMSAVWFYGELDRWELREGLLGMEIVSPLVRWTQRLLSAHPASCRWEVFKGTECQYSGIETWCDRTYSRCQALSNTANFGGFRFLPSLESAEIWWGRVRAPALR